MSIPKPHDMAVTPARHRVKNKARLNLPVALFWLLLVLFLTAYTSGCARAGQDGAELVLIEMTTTSTARVGSPSEVLLRVTWEGGPVQGANVTLEALSPASVTASLQAPATEKFFGEYHATLVWPTAGTWQLVARATLPDGLVVEREVGTVEVVP